MTNVNAQKPLQIEGFAKYKELFSEKNTPNCDVITYAKAFVGVPYEGATLEKGNDKQCLAYLQGFDCTTYVENVLAFFFSNQISEQEFVQNLTKLRYRSGMPSGYSSRLHYLTEWIVDNEQKGFLKDITKELGGAPFKDTINFMTKHRKLYPALKSKTDFEAMQVVENKLSNLQRYVIPKTQLSNNISKIKEGDIIAFTTDIKGLDFVHLGFAVNCKKDRKIYLLHASSKAKKVVISKKTLAEYARDYKKVSGIVVLRVCQR